VEGIQATDVQTMRSPLVCVLPQGALPSELFEIADLGLNLRTDQLVRFQAYSSSRQSGSRAGDIVPWTEGEFHALPPLQTIVRMAEPSCPETGGILPVHLTARMNALGLLQISCVSADSGIQKSWPLEFNVREHVQGAAGSPGVRHAHQASAPIEPNAAAQELEMACRQIGAVFTQPANNNKKNKVTAATILKSLERILGSPKSEWNGPLLRALWPALEERLDDRRLSVDHEEAWLIMAGFLLRPGFGVVRDGLRMDSLWRLRDRGQCFPGRRIKSQEYILWRRVAGGLTRERQNKLLAGELDRIRSGQAPDELVRLAGSLELIPHDTKAELVRCFIDIAVTLARAKRHCAPYLAALGFLLNRTSALRRARNRRLARTRRASVLGLPGFRLDYARAARSADSVPPGRAGRRRSESGRTQGVARPDCQQNREIRRPRTANYNDQGVHAGRTVRPCQPVRGVAPPRPYPGRKP
jgi:hypothetical protein